MGVRIAGVRSREQFEVYYIRRIVIVSADMIQELIKEITAEQVFGVWFLIGAALVFWMQAGFARWRPGSRGPRTRAISS